MMQRGRARTVALGWCMALLLGLAGVQQAHACAGAAVADNAGAAFLNAAKQASPRAFANALAAYTDMGKITEFALGKYRSQLPANRRSELIDLTAHYVSTTLADFALKFRGIGIRAIECRSDQVVSRLEFGGGRAAKRVIWRIDGGKVTDVNVQDVWLAQILRDNFTGVIQKGGGNIEALFRHLGARKQADHQ